jgi:hypothetical protein
MSARRGREPWQSGTPLSKGHAQYCTEPWRNKWHGKQRHKEFCHQMPPCLSRGRLTASSKTFTLLFATPGVSGAADIRNGIDTKPERRGKKQRGWSQQESRKHEKIKQNENASNSWETKNIGIKLGKCRKQNRRGKWKEEVLVWIKLW